MATDVFVRFEANFERGYVGSISFPEAAILLYSDWDH